MEFSQNTVVNTSDDDCPRDQVIFQIIKMFILLFDD